VLTPEWDEAVQYWIEDVSPLIDPGDNPLEPTADIIYPVINQFDSIKLIENDKLEDPAIESDTNEVVAILSSTFFWRDVLKNVLPEISKGLIVVIENACTVSITYQIE
jgi:hypothetical protein